MNRLHVTFISGPYCRPRPHTPMPHLIGLPLSATGRDLKQRRNGHPGDCNRPPEFAPLECSDRTGHATDVTSQSSAKSSTSGLVAAAPHWTSKVATGHAAESSGPHRIVGNRRFANPSRVDRHQ
jgi:hypothetical protein